MLTRCGSLRHINQNQIMSKTRSTCIDRTTGEVVEVIKFDYTKIYKKSWKGKKSHTVPDQSLTARQLLNKFATGQLVSDGKTPIFEDPAYPSEGIDPRKLDFSDVEQMLNENEDQIKNIRKSETERQQKYRSEEAKKKTSSKDGEDA